MNTRWILGAAAALFMQAGWVSQSAQAVVAPPLGLAEPVDLIFSSEVLVSYDPAGGGVGIGTLNVIFGSGQMSILPSNTVLDDEVFELTMDIDLATSEVISGHLEVGGELLGVDHTYFFSNAKPLFGFNGFGGFEFVFIQQNKPVTDETFAQIGNEIGVLLILDSFAAVDLDVSILDDQTAIAKVFGTDGFFEEGGEVPEPVTAGLAMSGLTALGLALTRRSARAS